jgi:hypothetical protein
VYALPQDRPDKVKGKVADPERVMVVPGHGIFHGIPNECVFISLNLRDFGVLFIIEWE